MGGRHTFTAFRLAGMMPALVAKLIIHTTEGPREADLKDWNSLGRHPRNTVQILDRIVSKEHCVIERRDRRYILRDLGSLNGTLVNGQRVQEWALRDWDELKLGNTRIVFHDQSTVNPALQRVTIGPGEVESHIHKKISTTLEDRFLPEVQITDHEQLRQDYEKLRTAYELQRAIGLELDLDRLLNRILELSFDFLPADRGVILLFDQDAELRPRAVRTRSEKPNEEIVLSNSIIREALKEKAAVLSSDAMIDSRFSGSHSIIMQGIRSSMAVPILHKGEMLGMMILDSQVATGAFGEKDLQILSNIASQVAYFMENMKLAQQVETEAINRQKFQRMMSPNLAEKVLAGELEVEKGGRSLDATVVFADIRGFTSMSENQDAQQIVEMLNEYFELAVDVVFKHEGTLDKFMGDEIMSIWGAPVQHNDDPVRAVTAGIEMQQMLVDFNQMREAEGADPIRIGIGISTGSVVAGYLGSSHTMEYSVIGDTVNIAARLCQLAKPGEVIISESTFHRVRDYFDVTALPPTHVKGKREPLRIFNVLGLRGPWTDEITKPGMS
jgi:adenylate cyclase